jgi:hypothetical protein
MVSLDTICVESFNLFEMEVCVLEYRIEDDLQTPLNISYRYPLDQRRHDTSNTFPPKDFFRVCHAYVRQFTEFLNYARLI